MDVKKNFRYVVFLLSLAMLLAVSAPLFGQERAAAQQENDSLEATQRWIRDTLIKHVVFETPYPEKKYKSTIRVESVNFDGCHLTLNHVTTGSTPGRSSYSAKLTDLDPLSIRVLKLKRRLEDGSFVLLNKYLVILNAVEMKDKVRYVSKGLSLKQDRMMNYMSTYFVDEEIANKVVKAFAHLIKLCSASRKESGTIPDAPDEQQKESSLRPTILLTSLSRREKL
jgi:hypothetical protein